MTQDIKVTTIHFYCDAAHGWGKVNRNLLKELGIENKISNFSYQKGDYVYLEEDCDLTVLCDALKKRGEDVKFIEHYSKNSSIRNFDRYKVER